MYVILINAESLFVQIQLYGLFKKKGKVIFSLKSQNLFQEEMAFGLSLKR